MPLQTATTTPAAARKTITCGALPFFGGVVRAGSGPLR